MQNLLDLSRLSHHEIRALIVDILKAEGFKDVEFCQEEHADIDAMEPHKSIDGTTYFTKWYVKIFDDTKLGKVWLTTKKNIDDSFTHARLAVTTSSDTAEKTRASITSRKQALMAAVWGPDEVERLILQHEEITKKYFHTDVETIAGSYANWSRDKIITDIDLNHTSSDLSVGKGAPAPFVKPGVGKIPATGHQVLDPREGTKENAISIWGYHQETTLRPFHESEASEEICRDYYCVDDLFSYYTSSPARDRYVFRFAFERSIFDNSLVNFEEEYSWLVDARTDPAAASKVLKLSWMVVSEHECKVISYEEERGALRIVVDGPQKSSIEKEYRVSYLLRTLLHKDERFFFTIMHCPVFGFSYTMDLTATMQGPIEVVPFLPSEKKIRISRTPEVRPTKLHIFYDSVVPYRGGAVFKW